MKAKRNEVENAIVTLYDDESQAVKGQSEEAQLFYTDESCNTTNRSGGTRKKKVKGGKTTYYYS